MHGVRVVYEVKCGSGPARIIRRLVGRLASTNTTKLAPSFVVGSDWVGWPYPLLICDDFHGNPQ